MPRQMRASADVTEPQDAAALFRTHFPRMARLAFVLTVIIVTDTPDPDSGRQIVVTASQTALPPSTITARG
jgi:hypothetical protein